MSTEDFKSEEAISGETVPDIKSTDTSFENLSHEQKLDKLEDSIDGAEDFYDAIDSLAGDTFSKKEREDFMRGDIRKNIETESKGLDKIKVIFTRRTESAINGVLKLVGVEDTGEGFSKETVDKATEKVAKNRDISEYSEKTINAYVDSLEEGIGRDILDAKDRLRDFDKRAEKTLKTLESLEGIQSEEELENLKQRAIQEREQLNNDIKERSSELQENDLILNTRENKEQLDQSLERYNDLYHKTVEHRKSLTEEEKKLSQAFKVLEDNEDWSFEEVKEEIKEKLEITKEQLNEIKEREEKLKERLQEVRNNKNEIDKLFNRLNSIGKTPKEIREEKRIARKTIEEESPNKEDLAAEEKTPVDDLELDNLSMENDDNDDSEDDKDEEGLEGGDEDIFEDETESIEDEDGESLTEESETNISDNIEKREEAEEKIDKIIATAIRMNKELEDKIRPSETDSGENLRKLIKYFGSDNPRKEINQSDAQNGLRKLFMEELKLGSLAATSTAKKIVNNIYGEEK